MGFRRRYGEDEKNNEWNFLNNLCLGNKIRRRKDGKWQHIKGRLIDGK
jgi:hypothetical protein